MVFYAMLMKRKKNPKHVFPSLRCNITLQSKHFVDSDRVFVNLEFVLVFMFVFFTLTEYPIDDLISVSFFVVVVTF